MRYGGTATWDGAATFTLPKQPATRRLVWLAVVASMDGGTTPVGCVLTILDGTNQVERQHVAGGMLTDGVGFSTMFFFAENVGNDASMTTNAFAQITCSLGRAAYVDTTNLLRVDLDAPPSSGSAKITWVFEDIV